MNDGNKIYRLSPKLSQFVADMPGMILLFLVSVLFTGVDNYELRLIAFGMTVLTFFFLAYRFWFFTTVEWIVTSDKIKYKRGVFNRSTDFLELYRVIDYKEEQNLIQQIFNIKTLFIYSGDKSHEVLAIYGISENNNIVDFIRENVELQKKNKKIYEITNT